MQRFADILPIQRLIRRMPLSLLRDGPLTLEAMTLFAAAMFRQPVADVGFG